jgi:hypothetical protein
MEEYLSLFKQSLSEESTVSGLDADEVLRSAHPYPRFVRAYARRAAQLRISPRELLAREFARLRGTSYPSSDCLQPHEIEIYSRTHQLTKSQRRHLESCGPCAALVAASEVDQSRLSDFIRKVRQSPRASGQSGSSRSSRPEQAHPCSAALSDTSGVLNVDAALEVVGRALMRVADALEDRYDRRPVFRAVLDHVKSQYSNRSSWDLDLLMQANDQGWSGWAVETLPSLYIPLSSDGSTALVWHYLVACIPQNYKCEVVDELCDKLVFEVNMGVVTAVLIKWLAPIIESNRLGNPYPSNQSMRQTAVESILEAEHLAKEAGRTKDAEALARVRNELQGSAALLPDFDGIIGALELLAEAHLPAEGSLHIEPLRMLYPKSIPRIRDAVKKKGLSELVQALSAA